MNNNGQLIFELIRENKLTRFSDILPRILHSGMSGANILFRMSLECAKNNQLDSALAILQFLQQQKNSDINIPYNVGLIHALNGDAQLAIEAYDLALQIDPNDLDTLINKGSSLNTLKKYGDAAQVLNQAIALNPGIPEAWFNKGIALTNMGLYHDAVNSYNEALKLDQNYFEAWSNISIPLMSLANLKEAISSCDKALRLKVDFAEAWFNKGVCLHEQKQYRDAIAHFDKALSLKVDFAEAWFNKGVCLHEQKQYRDAIAHFDKALSLKVDFAEAWSNKGVCLHEQKQYRDAIAHFDKALSLKVDFAEAWSNKGKSLHELGFYEEAIEYYEKSLELKPEINWIYGDYLHLKMKICRWTELKKEINGLISGVCANKKLCHPLYFLSLVEDGLLQKKSSEIFIQACYPSRHELGKILARPKKDRIRIGYFSADFKTHPVAFLMAEFFKIHNRDNFEIYAFSLKKPPNDDVMHDQIARTFDHFIDVEGESSIKVASMARELKIDIAVDLMGHTQHSRIDIFAYRAAPVQAAYLGYPGTSGADYIDYIIADRVVIPASNRQCFKEKIAYLPNSFMVDDSRRVPSEKKFSRKECGLPENGFVFCCFNNDYKFNGTVLESWSRILGAVDGSVLWVPENNKYFQKNIQIQFEMVGVSPSRIVFAKRIESVFDHLARCSLADLFLDTYPYNAHSTAMDSLKAGVPIVTLMGASYAGRVTASLLHAINMPDLIAESINEYEVLAIELATKPQKLKEIRERLVSNCMSAPLFNTALFVKNMEVIFSKMYEQSISDTAPSHLFSE